MHPILVAFLKAWNSRYKLRIVLGIVVAFLFFWVLGKTASNLVSKEEVPLGSIIEVKCKSCGHTCSMRVFDINDSSVKCPKCKGKVGYRQKCLACGFEFAFNPPDTGDSLKGKGKSEIIAFLAQQKACPNCGSTRTARMSPENP